MRFGRKRVKRAKECSGDTGSILFSSYPLPAHAPIVTQKSLHCEGECAERVVILKSDVSGLYIWEKIVINDSKGRKERSSKKELILFIPSVDVQIIDETLYGKRKHLVDMLKREFDKDALAATERVRDIDSSTKLSLFNSVSSFAV